MKRQSVYGLLTATISENKNTLDDGNIRNDEKGDVLMDITALRTVDHTAVIKALAVEVMGYRKSGDLFVKDGEYPLTIREFNPLENLNDAFKVLQSISSNAYDTSYTLKSQGVGHSCLIFNDSVQRAGSANAMTPEMAICMSVLDYCDIQTDFEDATENELYPRKEAV